MKKIILFGAGKIAHDAIGYLAKDYEILTIVDNNKELWGSMVENISVSSPEVIFGADFDFIVITCGYWKAILKQLVLEFKIENAMLYQKQNVSVTENGKKNGEYFLKEIYGGRFYDGLKIPNANIAEGSILKKRNVNKNSKHILVLAYYFPPLGSSPIQRTLKFVKYLSKMQFQITVVTVDEAIDGILDKSLVEEIPSNVRVIRFPNNYHEKEYIQYKDREKILNFLYIENWKDSFIDELCMAQEAQNLYILPDKLVLWAVEVFEHIGRCVDMSEIDVLYSTVPEWSPHILAYKLKQKYHIPWIADYRDPWVASDPYVKAVYPYMVQDEISFDRKLESFLVQDMDAIVVAGESWKKLYADTYEIPSELIHVISNGYDEDDFEGLIFRNRKNDKFTLCYNGSLGYNRKPRYVLETISSLIADGEIDKEKIQWIFNGPLPEWMYQSEIMPFDRFHIVRNNQMLSHKESLQVTMDSDVLIMYGEVEEMANLNYPAKFYEYLRIGRPILCFSAPDSPQDRILHETGLGKNYDLKDLDEIRNYLIKAYKDWDKYDVIRSKCGASINSYNRERLTEKLANIIQQLS